MHVHLIHFAEACASMIGGWFGPFLGLVAGLAGYWRRPSRRVEPVVEVTGALREDCRLEVRAAGGIWLRVTVVGPAGDPEGGPGES